MNNEKINAKEVAKENVANATSENFNAAKNAASINNLNITNMEGNKNSTVAQTTRVAIIDGVERVITVAHTKYSMELPKDKKELCKKLDPNKMLSTTYHFSKPELFWQEGCDLYDENNNLIEKGTPDVFVFIQKSDNFWRIGLEDRLEKTELVEFSTVQEYAQVVASTNLYSRGMTDTERVGVAALATGNKAYMAVYEFAKEHKMNLTTAKMYLDVAMSKTQIMEMSIGNMPEFAPKMGRTQKQAAELLKQAENSFGENARKRYVIRPVNTLGHQPEYGREMILKALKDITKEDALKVDIASSDAREAMVTSLLTKYLEKNLQKGGIEKQVA